MIEIRHIAADQTKTGLEIHEAVEEEIVNEVVIIEVIEKTKVIIGQIETETGTGIEVIEMGTGIEIGIEVIIEAADVADHVIEITDHVIETTDQGVRIGFLVRILTRKKTLVKALQGIKKWKEMTRKQAALPHHHLHQRQI